MARKCLRGIKILFIFQFLAVVLLSFSVSLIPLVYRDGDDINEVALYPIAALFWLSLIAMVVLTIFIRIRLKHHGDELGLNSRINGALGAFSFAFDPKRCVIYSITLSGMIVIVFDVIFGYIPEQIMFPIISITLLSFATHCIVDGNNIKVFKLIKENFSYETDQ